MTQPLGNITNFDSAPPMDEHELRELRDMSVQTRYRLQDVARELLPDFRVSFCLHRTIPNKQLEIWRDTESGNAHFKGVMRCGSVWVCPVCAAKVAIGRRNDVLEALAKAKALGWDVLFVTLTARHTREDTLKENLVNSKEAMRFMRKIRQWGRLRADYGLEGSIDAVEMTWGFASGWHVHYHAIYFFSKPVSDVQAIEAQICDLWEHSLARSGMDCDREHGVKVEPGFDKAADYVTKWALQTELTSREKPGREGHFGPFQLLGLYERGELWAGRLFQEYADATKGLSSLRFSRGLRAKLGMNDEPTDEELAEAPESESSVRLLALTDEQVKKLRYSGRRGVLGELLLVAERGQDAALLWLGTVFGIYPLVL